MNTELRKCKRCSETFPCTLEFFKDMDGKNGIRYFSHACRKCANNKQQMNRTERGEGVGLFCCLPGWKHCWGCNTTLTLDSFMKGSFKCKNCFRKKIGSKPQRIGKEANENERECFVCNTIKNIDQFAFYRSLKNKKKRRTCFACENQKRKDKFYSNTNFRIAVNLRSAVTRHLKDAKECKSIELLGCSIEEFVKYIESQFKDGMTWDNYGKHGWHLDHILPCALFNLENKEAQLICFNYRNFQPMWRFENISKRDKLPDGMLARNIDKKIETLLEFEEFKKKVLDTSC